MKENFKLIVNLLHRGLHTHRKQEEVLDVSLLLYSLVLSTYVIRILVILIISLELNSVCIKQSSNKHIHEKKSGNMSYLGMQLNYLLHNFLKAYRALGLFSLSLYRKVEIKSIELLHTSFLEVSGKLCSFFNHTKDSSPRILQMIGMCPKSPQLKD